MFDFDLDDKGYIKKRESYNLEFKQNFQRDDSFLRYIKTLVGMANNKGGMIVFGVKDSPHIPVGMTNTKMTYSFIIILTSVIKLYPYLSLFNQLLSDTVSVIFVSIQGC